MRSPSFGIERALVAQGYRAIVGVDEVGCGALAGPVVAGAVILPFNSRLGTIRDSKLLSPKQRYEMYDRILDRALAWGTGSASVGEIHTLGLRPANLLAMRRAVEQIRNVEVDYVLVDAWTIPGLAVPQRGIIHGDRLVKSIAAASIIAKVTRDRLMTTLARDYPTYGFEDHKGYGTAAHKQAIRTHGPCAIHRVEWKPFREALFN